jgi:hypothetical protein
VWKSWNFLYQHPKQRRTAAAIEINILRDLRIALGDFAPAPQ